MILSGKEIKKHIGNDIIIDPFNESQLNPNSYNLRLADELLLYIPNTLHMDRDNPTCKIHIPQDGYTLHPGKLYLGRTVEYTKTDKFVPMIEGRSSIGRLGLFVHVTAGFGDVGFAGYWTLELHCVQPIVIYPNIEICQIFYHDITSEYDKYDKGKYQNNNGIQPSMLWKDFQK